MRILVTGATGYVGSRLVTALLERGARGRRRQRATSSGSADFGWFDDVTPVALDAARRGLGARARSPWRARSTSSTTWCTASGSRTSASRQLAPRPTSPPRRRDAGVRRIVYLGGFVPDDGAAAPNTWPAAPRSPSALTRRRRPRGGVAGCGDDHRRGVDVVRDAALRRRPIPADPACRRGRTTRSTRSRSATCCTTSSPRPIGTRCLPARYDIHGPETTTYGELLTTYARLSGKWRGTVCRVPGRAPCRWCPGSTAVAAAGARRPGRRSR